MLDFFVSNDPTHGYELWVTDGTRSGTRLVLDINPGEASSYPSWISYLSSGEALFSADDGVHGTELWISDGMAQGTRLLVDIYPGDGGLIANSSYPSGFGSLGGGRFLFGADDSLHDDELWVNDGTAEGTHLLNDIADAQYFSGIYGSYPHAFTNLGGGRAVFTASDAAGQTSVWSTDGTPEGLVRLAPVSASYFVPLAGGVALFSDFTGLQQGIWRTDGTTAGTWRLMDQALGANSSTIAPLSDGRAIFTVGQYADVAVWVTDGTAQGTHPLDALAAGIKPAHPTSADEPIWVLDEQTGNLAILQYQPYYSYGALSGGRTIFVDNTAENGYGSYVTDGTRGGTHFLGQYHPTGFTDLGDGRVLFTSYDTASGNTTYISDGTAAGTYVVKANFDSAGAVDYAAVTEDLVIDLVGNVADGPGGGTFGHRTLDGIDKVISGQGDDYIAGNSHSNYLDGAAGNDRIFGGSSSDAIYGGAGNDNLLGQDDPFAYETDILSGGDGDDTLSGEVADAIDGGAGHDVLIAVNDHSWSIDLGATSIEYMRAGFGNDVLDGSTQVAGLEIYAGGGNDVVTGGSGNDVIWGETGDDTLTGGDGNDVLFGALGQDSQSGGNGDDLIFADSTDTFLDGGAGFDVLYITSSPGMAFDLQASGFEFAVDLAGGDDTVDGSAMSVDVTVYAGGGTDAITGGNGADFLWGEAGSDTITGGIGNDVLVGGTGADVLTGGSGIDTVYLNSGGGSDGALDSVAFTAGWGTDFVFDFVHGEDKIDLTSLGTNFAALTITTSDGHAYVSIGAGPDLIAVANNGGLLTAGDFLF